MAKQGKRTRVPQAERREDVIEAALIEFGRYGYAGTSTAMIAERAGIRQPYIYALFENKRALFLACHDALNERILETFRNVALPEDSPYERLRKMGVAYHDLLTDDARARCHLQIFAATGADDLRKPIRAGFVALFEELCELSGAGKPEVAQFFATGLFLNALTALGDPSRFFSYLEVTPEDEL